jgi:hypothetical protein
MNIETIDDALEIIQENREVLGDLIASYHPASRTSRRSQSLPITAPDVERNCDIVRGIIELEESVMVMSPLERFDRAIGSGDFREIDSLFQSTWFGVPESTSCWEIPGFSLMVDIMDAGLCEEEMNEE